MSRFIALFTAWNSCLFPGCFKCKDHEGRDRLSFVHHYLDQCLHTWFSKCVIITQLSLTVTALSSSFVWLPIWLLSSLNNQLTQSFAHLHFAFLFPLPMDSLQMAYFHSFFMVEYYSIVCMYNILFSHSSVSGHWGCFHVLAVVSNAAVNMWVHVSFEVSIFIFFRYSEVELLDHMVSCIVNFLRNLHMIFHTGWTSLYFHQQLHNKERKSTCSVGSDSLRPHGL